MPATNNAIGGLQLQQPSEQAFLLTVLSIDMNNEA
jgi:hypothetical protein